MATERPPARPVIRPLGPYREIRSARFPGGFPDRSDQTVIDAFADAWLLIEHTPDGSELVGVADDYDAARAWLDESRRARPADGS